MSVLGTWLRRAVFVLTLLLLALGVLTARAVVEGREQMALSDRSFHAGDVRTSALHARRAATLYAPGAPHVRRAYERLLAIAVGAEHRGEPEVAETAWRSIRAAALESSHLWTPHRQELRQASRRLEQLRRGSASSLEPASDAATPGRVAFAEQGAGAPAAEWVFVLLGGLALMIVGMALFAFRGISDKGALIWSQARLAAVLALIGAACWTVALFQA